MQFDENKAAEIVEKFGLKKKTIMVWRTRGAIPDRYFSEGFAIKGKTEGVLAEGERDEQAIRDFRRVFGHGYGK